MSKGLFYYQLPNSSSIQGCEGEWNLVEKLENCVNGIVVSSFNKEQIFSMSDFSHVDLSNIEKINPDIAKPYIKVDKEDYQEIVKSAIKFCETESGKVVVSRVKRHFVDAVINIRELFEAQCQLYAHAFNYLCYVPGIGTWIGASPEKLLVGKAPHFEIASLAGSRSLGDKFEWTNKEIHEQEMVSSSIEEVLDNLSINYSKSETKTVQAGNLEHLFTGYRTEDCESPWLLAEQLHPTPAVSGLPKQKAIGFINKTETHEREFYTGIIGLSINDRFDLYVNLRCARIYENAIDLYVGGGITSDSIPKNEWEETEFKSQTLLSIIEKM